MPNPLVKVTIVPRGRSLGAGLVICPEEKTKSTKYEQFD